MTMTTFHYPKAENLPLIRHIAGIDPDFRAALAQILADTDPAATQRPTGARGTPPTGPKPEGNHPPPFAAAPPYGPPVRHDEPRRSRQALPARRPAQPAHRTKL